MTCYNYNYIEKKWLKAWNETDIYKKRSNYKDKFYCLDMFPYPSAAGLHVGHWRGYVLSDIYSRMMWLSNCDVLHPMGWDAFGLPAENFAIQNKVHPEECTKKNIETFRNQIKTIGAMIDWTREVDTTDPKYYKWTQWIFIKMFQAGLAYEDYIEINWCPSCKTGLANEEVTKGQCERCKSYVENKKIRQWMLKITKYAEQLLSGLEKLDWPEKVKTMQKNWIGKSFGLEITYKIFESNEKIIIFTTKPETIFGVTFLAISKEHKLINKIIKPELLDSFNKIQDSFKRKKNYNNQENNSDPIGFFTGSYAIHPITGEKIPTFIVDYVINEYGSGAIQGVPAHDERDFKFAKKYNLDIKSVIQDPSGDNIDLYCGDGILFNSNNFDGMESNGNGKNAISNFLIQSGLASKKINYKMRDWIFSRQRYWGEPIPLIHCKNCGTIPVKDEDLPVKLPYVEKYEPTGDGDSPLKAIESWVNTNCYKCNGEAKRETNTMPQWAGSCWYFLRYVSPNNDNHFIDEKDCMKWMPIDLYVGGVEHAILHLLYSRFYVKFLYESGYLHFDEPFMKLFNQGMITKYSEKSKAVEKMSKSKGNVVNPDELIKKYGSDSLRLYIIFLGPPEMDCQWQENGIDGCYRFIQRLWNVITNEQFACLENEESDSSKKSLNLFLKTFNQRLETFHCNTAVSAAMEFVNSIYAEELKFSKKSKEIILTALSTMIPFVCSELLENECGKQLNQVSWPKYDETILIEKNINIAIQINGKMRGVLNVDSCAGKDYIEKMAKEAIPKWFENKNVKKIFYIAKKTINFVIE
jgi:leucyl-tRNA synthetase